MTDVQVKVCPDCAEPVKSAAKVCRFCGHHFVEPPQPISRRGKVGLGIFAALVVLMVVAILVGATAVASYIVSGFVAVAIVAWLIGRALDF